MDCMSARNSCWLGWVWVSRSEQTDPRKNSFPRPDFLYLFSGGPCQNNEYFFLSLRVLFQDPERKMQQPSFIYTHSKKNLTPSSGSSSGSDTLVITYNY